MLEILQFIFSSFWIWLGTVVLVAIPFEALARIGWGIARLASARKNRDAKGGE